MVEQENTAVVDGNEEIIASILDEEKILNGERVLVVDDPGITEYFVDFLSHWGAGQVDTAFDAETALKMLSEADPPYGLAIINIELPPNFNILEFRLNKQHNIDDITRREIESGEESSGSESSFDLERRIQMAELFFSPTIDFEAGAAVLEKWTKSLCDKFGPEFKQPTAIVAIADGHEQAVIDRIKASNKWCRVLGLMPMLEILKSTIKELLAAKPAK